MEKKIIKKFYIMQLLPHASFEVTSHRSSEKHK